VETVDSPWVGINLDTGNFRTDPYGQIAMCLPHAVNSQFKTAIHADGRDEPSDWERIVKMFAEAGYQGYLALEYEAREDPAAAMPRYLGRLRDLARKYSS
jgi:sugar phosphate isomerase/epimerase